MLDRVTLYRADKRPGLSRVGGRQSWTSHIDYARLYQAGFGMRPGIGCLYRADIEVDPDTVTNQQQLDDLVDAIGSGPAETGEAAATEFLAQYQWLMMGPEWLGFDEWLYLGSTPIRVRRVPHVPGEPAATLNRYRRLLAQRPA